jgi:hypothetical protein
MPRSGEEIFWALDVGNKALGRCEWALGAVGVGGRWVVWGSDGEVPGSSGASLGPVGRSVSSGAAGVVRGCRGG